MKSRMFYIGLNLIAPGMGQLALRWYFRGIVELILASIAVVWSFFVLFMPLFKFLSDTSNQNIHLNYPALFLSVFLLLGVWAWSIVEVILFYPGGDKGDEPKEQEKS